MTREWAGLLDEGAIARLLPSTHASFARPVGEALEFFLRGLPKSDASAILAEQARLPQQTPLSERLGRLARHCPVLQKLGQTLARDQRLPVSFRRHLQELEHLPCTLPTPRIEEVLIRELGPLADLGLTLAPPALAEASVAVVIPFEVQSWAVAQYPFSRGVFKVLKPGIRERLEYELDLLERVGQYLDERCQELRIPPLDYEQTFQQVRQKLQEEVYLDHEQRHLAEAQSFYHDEPRVLIPKLLGPCTSQVTAMERVFGEKITERRWCPPAAGDSLAGPLIQALIAKPIFSRADRALFHADPHAGNLYRSHDGRLAILDWSLVGHLHDLDRVRIVQIVLGAIGFDPKQIEDVLVQWADPQKIDRRALARVIESSLRTVRYGRLPNLSWLINLLDEATQTAQLRVPADLMLFRKTLLTLTGVVAEVEGPPVDLDGVLLGEFLRHWIAEWPARWLTAPTSRDFATRLSNWDLIKTALHLPTTLTRYWVQGLKDLIPSSFRKSIASPTP